MRMRLPSRYSLSLFCVVSILLGCVSPVSAAELTLSSLTQVDGLVFQSSPVDQSAITSYDFSEKTSQGLVLATESAPEHLQPLVISQEVLETPSFIQAPVDPLPSDEPSITPSPTTSPARITTQNVAGGPTDTPTPSPTKVITPTINQQITTTTTPTPTATPTPTDTPTPTPTPTLPPIPAASDIDGYFAKYSDEYHVDVTVLRRIARCESGYNAHAQYMDYGGMFQFATSSWTVTRQAMGMDTNPDLRFSAEESIRTAAFKIGRDGTGAWPNC